MFLDTIDIGIIFIGDTFTITLDGVTYPSVKNLGPGIAYNAKLTITRPSGISFDPGNSTVPRGIFNEATGEWDIGSVLAGESLTPTFAFYIEDDCPPLPRTISFVITSDSCECDFANNTFEIDVVGDSCCRINECYSTTHEVTKYLSQGANFGYTVCSENHKVLLVEPTADITITLTGGGLECKSDSIIIKHIGQSANRVWKIRVISSSGNMDSDTYFEFDNVGSALNNLRGYNFTSFKFVWDGTDFWVF